MKINIEFIPHKDHRYETVGDWFWKDGTLEIRVSKMGLEEFEWCVALHEVIEAALCYLVGVTEKDVDDFDKAYKPKRDYFEPGDDPRAPYHKQHVTASICERAIGSMLDIDWNEYIATLEDL